MNYKPILNLDLTGFPKVELHLHLDCSLSFDVVSKLSPNTSKQRYDEHFKAPINCQSLVEYIKRANAALEIMQNASQLEMVTLDLFKQLKKDNVRYAEFRFAPLLHLIGGMSSREVVSTVEAAVQKGVQDFGIEVNLILATLRHYSEKQSMETVKLAHDFKGSRVVGLDIASDEAGFPIDNHIKAFEYAHAHEIHRTAHAGEACGCDSVWETLKNFYPTRIGHGVRSAEDPKLIEHLKENQIHLEVCPTSNLQTGVFKRIEDHTVNHLYHEGVSLGISTDGRTISNVNLNDEYNLLRDTFEWGVEDFYKVNLMAIEACFASETIKSKLSSEIDMAYSSLNS